ncbi:hypothetical protein M3650_02220 [Paenibacillus sp. MER TA 81-3]|uniref:hypothetical protein n=1 Tax=Paenibacillus sp. MER TA 81-3 TaxID=2939573 RepID=UPI00203A3E25|nr:hypothetical protein [Paenibacillus sp. MER TA 81-3]MCM3337492.1 hypothetical protein [Paenibacillus sp. MER TA 81-3]
MSNYENVLQALERKGWSTKGLDVKFLGEGAWFKAYWFTTNERESAVIRFPQPVSYGKPFQYDETELLTEFASRGLYYEAANNLVPGICPQWYTYDVQPDLSFTIEAYCGDTLRLKQTDDTQAAQLGRQCGELCRAMTGMQLGIDGFGFLEWREGRLHGTTQGDHQEYWIQDTNGYWEQFEQFLANDYPCQSGAIKDKLQRIIERRLQSECTLSLANRDISPENITTMNGSIRLIDPYPLYYNGHVFAGNLLNNFKTLFPSYYRSPRYAKHQFHVYQRQLECFAEGFLDGYAQGEREIRMTVLMEEYLMLFDLTVEHMNLLKQDHFQEETVLRAGNREAVGERMPGYVKRLEQFNFDI